MGGCKAGVGLEFMFAGACSPLTPHHFTTDTVRKLLLSSVAIVCTAASAAAVTALLTRLLLPSLVGWHPGLRLAAVARNVRGRKLVTSPTLMAAVRDGPDKDAAAAREQRKSRKKEAKRAR